MASSLAIVVAECCIDDEPAVRGFREDIEIDDLLDKVCFKCMPALGIDDDQFVIFECRKTFPGDLDGILFRGLPKQGTWILVQRVLRSGQRHPGGTYRHRSPRLSYPFFWK